MNNSLIYPDAPKVARMWRGRPVLGEKELREMDCDLPPEHGYDDLWTLAAVDEVLAYVRRKEREDKGEEENRLRWKIGINA